MIPGTAANDDNPVLEVNKMITPRDTQEFAGYVRTLSDCQLFNVLEKEAEAERFPYVRVTLQEIKRRRARNFRKGT